MSAVDLDDPPQRGEGVEVQEAVLRQGVQRRLGRGPQPCESVGEQHDELLAFRAECVGPRRRGQRRGSRPGREVSHHRRRGSAARSFALPAASPSCGLRFALSLAGESPTFSGARGAGRAQRMAEVSAAGLSGRSGPVVSEGSGPADADIVGDVPSPASSAGSALVSAAGHLYSRLCPVPGQLRRRSANPTGAGGAPASTRSGEASLSMERVTTCPSRASGAGASRQ